MTDEETNFGNSAKNEIDKSGVVRSSLSLLITVQLHRELVSWLAYGCGTLIVSACKIQAVFHLSSC